MDDIINFLKVPKEFYLSLKKKLNILTFSIQLKNKHHLSHQLSVAKKVHYC